MELSLHLPSYRNHLKMRTTRDRHEIWDPIRRKYVPMTPEEIVRQLFIHFLLAEQKTTRTRISVERQITVFGQQRRYDLMIHDRTGAPLALIEVKAPQITLSQAVLDQIARYNLVTNVTYLIVTNGARTWCMQIDPVEQRVNYLSTIPDFNDE